MNKTVSILGCGWLGLPLGSDLASRGYSIKGSTTTEKKLDILKSSGIEPFLLELSPEISGNNFESFFSTDVLIISIPPGTRKKRPFSHTDQIHHLLDSIIDIDHIIYISSTSTYPSNDKIASEEDRLTPENTGNQVLIQAESMLNATVKNLTVLRCGGLFGYERIPGKYFQGKKNLKTGLVPSNYVHRDDVLNVLLRVIESKPSCGIFNMVAPHHPIKKDIYFKNAREFNFSRPSFDISARENYKIVDSRKIIETFDYQFKYPDPLNFPYSKD